MLSCKSRRYSLLCWILLQSDSFLQCMIWLVPGRHSAKPLQFVFSSFRLFRVRMMTPEDDGNNPWWICGQGINYFTSPPWKLAVLPTLPLPAARFNSGLRLTRWDHSVIMPHSWPRKGRKEGKRAKSTRKRADYQCCLLQSETDII